MPTYEYRCRDCGEQLEVVQSFTDDALTECPACSGSLRKVFGSIGVTFKGSGFYKTDSRGSSKSSSSGGDGGGSDPKADGASSGTETKTETKKTETTTSSSSSSSSSSTSSSGSGSTSAA